MIGKIDQKGSYSTWQKMIDSRVKSKSNWAVQKSRFVISKLIKSSLQVESKHCIAVFPTNILTFLFRKHHHKSHFRFIIHTSFQFTDSGWSTALWGDDVVLKSDMSKQYLVTWVPSVKTCYRSPKCFRDSYSNLRDRSRQAHSHTKYPWSQWVIEFHRMGYG